MKKKIPLIILGLILLLVLVIFLIFLEKKEKSKLTLNLDPQGQTTNLRNIVTYSHYIITTKTKTIYDSNKKEIGTIEKGTELILDSNYTSDPTYYKLEETSLYLTKDSIAPLKELSSTKTNTEYKTYKNYLPYNENILTTDNYELLIDNQSKITLKSSSSYPIIIKDEDKYGLEFNNQLYYLPSKYVSKIEETSNTDKNPASSIAVLNYHYTINKEAGEDKLCRQTICMEDTQVEEEIKYLKDNNYYATTMRDLELYVNKKIRLPEHSVTITIDDGWFVARMITILEKYQTMGTLFLIGSLASPNDYKSNYLEIHSHSWDMHTPKVCEGSHGGAILCWDKDKILTDLKKSRESLNNTTYFCYPFYEHNDRSKTLLKEAGFTMAFIGGSRKVRPGDDPYNLRRFELVTGTTLEDIKNFVS